jgi:hypothetical protein
MRKLTAIIVMALVVITAGAARADVTRSDGLVIRPVVPAHGQPSPYFVEGRKYTVVVFLEGGQKVFRRNLHGIRDGSRHSQEANRRRDHHHWQEHSDTENRWQGLSQVQRVALDLTLQSQHRLADYRSPMRTLLIALPIFATTAVSLSR